MTQHHRDLWPESIKTINETVAPIIILREQSAFLGEKTQNIVRAEISSDINALGVISDKFYLVAPALDNYRFALFGVVRSVAFFYPIKLNSETLEIDIEITTENELLSVLEKAFSHEKTINIVNSMLVQSGVSDGHN